MEYGLYRFRLKSLVDRALIRNIIESSASGEHPHYSVAMGLVIEKSIQEHRRRVSRKAKKDSKLTSKPEPKTSTEAPTAPIPQAKPLTPDPAPQSVSQSSSSSALSEPGEETKAGCLEEPPTYPQPDPHCYHNVDLPCSSCNSIASLSGKRLQYCIRRPDDILFRCTSCRTGLVRGTYACNKCRGGFEL